MSSSGDGGNFLEEAVSSLVENTTAGLVTYNKKDGYGKGKFLGHIGSDVGRAVKNVKDLSGTTVKEEALEESKKQFEETKADAQAQREAGQAEFNRNQLIKSKAASGSRRSVGRKTSGNRTPALGSDEQDFLGL